MNLTSKLYELRDEVAKSDVYIMYQTARKNALEDVQLKIFFGEIDKYTELIERFAKTADIKQYQQKLQQLKLSVFANEHYQQYRQAEKQINALRQQIAHVLFKEIDEEIITDYLKHKGGHRCG